MKKKYSAPVLELLYIEAADIITASVSGNPGDEEGGGNVGGWDDDNWD